MTRNSTIGILSRLVHLIPIVVFASLFTGGYDFDEQRWGIILSSIMSLVAPSKAAAQSSLNTAKSGCRAVIELWVTAIWTPIVNSSSGNPSLRNVANRKEGTKNRVKVAFWGLHDDRSGLRL